MSDTATVSKMPKCQLCADDITDAAYDAKTMFGPWAYVCEACFTSTCIGLGTGLGQRLVLAGEQN